MTIATYFDTFPPWVGLAVQLWIKAGSCCILRVRQRQNKILYLYLIHSAVPMAANVPNMWLSSLPFTHKAHLPLSHKGMGKFCYIVDKPSEMCFSLLPCHQIVFWSIWKIIAWCFFFILTLPINCIQGSDISVPWFYLCLAMFCNFFSLFHHQRSCWNQLRSLS